MTKPTFIPSFFWEEAKKQLARWAFLLIALAAGAIFTPYWATVVAIVRLPDRVEDLSQRLDDQKAAIARLSGEDRVIRQPPGMSYVVEPVHQGERVTLILVLERTALGAVCEFLGGQSLFTDAGRVATPGSAVTPSRQIGAERTPLRLVLDPPSILQPGRIQIDVNLSYQCPTSDGSMRRVYDKTDPVFYYLLPKPPARD